MDHLLAARFTTCMRQQGACKAPSSNIQTETRQILWNSKVASCKIIANVSNLTANVKASLVGHVASLKNPSQHFIYTQNIRQMAPLYPITITHYVSQNFQRDFLSSTKKHDTRSKINNEYHLRPTKHEEMLIREIEKYGSILQAIWHKRARTISSFASNSSNSLPISCNFKHLSARNDAYSLPNCIVDFCKSKTREGSRDYHSSRVRYG